MARLPRKRRRDGHSRVVLWMDWFSISQTNPAAKRDGISSLIKYVTLCPYMLITVAVETLNVDPFMNPADLPLYDERAWCRLEWLIFFKWAA